MKEKLTRLGAEPMMMTPEDFEARICKETTLAVPLAKSCRDVLRVLRRGVGAGCRI